MTSSHTDHLKSEVLSLPFQAHHRYFTHSHIYPMFCHTEITVSFTCHSVKFFLCLANLTYLMDAYSSSSKQLKYRLQFFWTLNILIKLLLFGLIALHSNYPNIYLLHRIIILLQQELYFIHLFIPTIQYNMCGIQCVFKKILIKYDWVNVFQQLLQAWTKR